MLSRQARIFFRFTGGYVLVWLAAGAVAAFALVFIELVISLQIANLLVMLGLVNQAVSFPFGLGKLSNNLTTFVVIFIGSGILRAFCYFLIAHSGNFAHEAILNRLRLLAFHESFGSERSMVSLASLTGWVSEHFHRATYFCLYVANLIPALVQLIFLTALLLKSSVHLTALAMVAIIIVGLLVHFVNGYARKIVASNPAIGDSMVQRMMRMARNKYLLKALRTMEREHKQLVLSSLRFATSIIRSNALSNFAGNLPQIFGMATLMLLVGEELRSHELTGMAFLSFLYLFLRMVQALSTASSAYGAMNSQYPAYRHVANYVEKFSDEEFERAVRPSDHLSAFGLRRSVEFFGTNNSKIEGLLNDQNGEPPSVTFKDVSFRYQENSSDVLRHFNLEIRSGEACAIMGASGSGKSTILGLLMGMMNPDSGEILLGGKDPQTFFSDPNLRLGFVGAEPYLIEGTIRENLLYGIRRDDIFDGELFSVLNRAQLSELIKVNPSLLDYQISESGEGLSSGQKQRLMFARALLGKPTLLVLDEASSNLDEETESLLAAEIRKLNGTCTTIIITHRSAFVKWVDNRISLVTQSDPLNCENI